MIVFLDKDNDFTNIEKMRHNSGGNMILQKRGK